MILKVEMEEQFGKLLQTFKTNLYKKASLLNIKIDRVSSRIDIYEEEQEEKYKIRSQKVDDDL